MSGKKMTIQGRRTARKVYESFNPKMEPDEVDDSLASWVENKVIRYNGFVRRADGGCRVCHCTHCGGVFPAPESKRVRKATCPHCGQILTIERSNRRKYRGITYVQKLKALDGYQLIRTYCVEYTIKIDSKPDIWVSHVFDWIMNEDGRDQQCYSVSLQMFPARCAIPFNRWSERMHRVRGGVGYDYHRGWDIAGICPGASCPAWARKYHLLGSRLKADMLDVLNAMITKPHFETLWKSGNAAAFILLYHRNGLNYWDQIKIARRAGFRFTEKNIHEWCDLVDMLGAEGLDVHNPKYIAPKNLKKMHDWMVGIRTRRFEKERREAELRELEHEEAERLAKAGKTGVQDQKYRERMGKVLSFKVEKGNITIAPLQNLKDFYEEGKVLHHCVFANSYYERPDSIILGARVNGRRTETIEVRTKNPIMIVQCRGKYDQDSPYHKEIISLMSSSLGRLMERVKAI